MATIGESSSPPLKSTANDKPVIVRVKRKSYQSRLDAFWLEINERPSKRPLLDFEKLSISDSVDAKVEEWKAKKLFVEHVETVSSSDTTIHVVKLFVSNSADVVEDKSKIEERKRTFQKDNKQEKLLSKAIQSQELLAKNARFEQIWRKRRGNKESRHDKELHDMCHFYDVIRVDAEERSSEAQEQEVTSLEDQRILHSYLPLLREFIPSAAEEIESDFFAHMSRQDDYVYDYYTVKHDMDIDDEGASRPFPLVQVEDEDFYDGPDDESEYDSDDSNAEAHPWNDYPEETSEEEDETESEASNSESEEEEDEDDIASIVSSEFEDPRHGLSEDADIPYEDQIYDDCFDEDGIYDDYFDDGNDFDYDDSGHGEDLR